MLRRPLFAAAVSSAALFLVSGAGCSSRGEVSAQRETPSEVAVGPRGGTVVSEDGRLTVVIPEGALTAEAAVRITETSDVPPGALGHAYAITPDDLELHVPVTISLRYEDGDLPPGDVEAIDVAFVVGDEWVSAGFASPEDDPKAVSAYSTHFSRWALVRRSRTSAMSPTGPARESCSSGGTCLAPFSHVPGIGCAIRCEQDRDCFEPNYCTEVLPGTRVCRARECTLAPGQPNTCRQLRHACLPLLRDRSLCASRCQYVFGATSTSGCEAGQICTVGRVCAHVSCLSDEGCSRTHLWPGERVVCSPALHTCLPAHVGENHARTCPSVPAQPSTPSPGWYGFANANNIDQEHNLKSRCASSFTRIHVATGNTFDDLCASVGLRCARVCDWEGVSRLCSDGPSESSQGDGSRIAYCETSPSTGDAGAAACVDAAGTTWTGTVYGTTQSVSIVANGCNHVSISAGALQTTGVLSGSTFTSTSPVCQNAGFTGDISCCTLTFSGAPRATSFAGTCFRAPKACSGNPDCAADEGTCVNGGCRQTAAVQGTRP